MDRRPVVSGVGSYAPEKVLTNEDLEERVDTSDEWIVQRTGIRQRHIVADDEATSDLGTRAARAALADAGLKPDELDLILVATATPDMSFPSTACVVQRNLGVHDAGAMDLSAACSGFIYGLSVAHGQIVGGQADRVLVVAAETLSRITDWEDRSTCVLFGDGAAAVVLSHDPDASRPSLLSQYLDADGDYGDILCQPGGGSARPIRADNVDEGLQYIHMDGPAVFKVAVRKMGEAAALALDRAGLDPDDVDWVIPHQANIRIIEAVRDQLDLPDEKIIVNVDRFGNTSAASIGLALDEARREGTIADGDRILMVAFGGGLTWASAVIQWPRTS